MTFDTSYDRYKIFIFYDTIEGQVGVIFVEIFRWSDDWFIVRMMIITENSQDYGPDHLQIDFTQLGHEKCFGSWHQKGFGTK